MLTHQNICSSLRAVLIAKEAAIKAVSDENGLPFRVLALY